MYPHSQLLVYVCFDHANLLYVSRAKSNKKRAPPSQGGNRKGHEKETKDKKHEKSNDRLTVTREATVAKEKQLEQLNARVATSGNLSERSESIEDGDKYVVSRE